MSVVADGPVESRHIFASEIQAGDRHDERWLGVLVTLNNSSLAQAKNQLLGRLAALIQAPKIY
jgi:hypothetical protein